MEVRAIAKFVRVQPRKVRIVADEIRGKSALHSAALLRYHPSKGAFMLRKVLLSAIANAQENHDLAPEQLKIQTIMVDEGPRLKRMQARAQGRGNRILKKTSHITVVVEDYEGEKQVKPHGTKAKARPTFAAPKGRKKGQQPAAPAVTEQEVTDTAAEETMPVEASTAPEEGADVAEAPVAAAEAGEGPAEEASPVTSSDAPEEEGSATAEEDSEKGA